MAFSDFGIFVPWSNVLKTREQTIEKSRLHISLFRKKWNIKQFYKQQIIVLKYRYSVLKKGPVELKGITD